MSLTVNEGSNNMFCVVLPNTAPSTNRLDIPLTVEVATEENAGAGWL